VTTPDPNNSIKVGGHSQAYGPDGSLLTSTSPNATALPYADATAIQGIASTTRTDGMEVIKLDDSTIWVFDAESAASASAWVLVPTSGSGRWLRKFVSTADLISTATGNGASLISIEDAATLFTATTIEGALAEIAQFKADLGSTANAKGASKVAIEDAGAFTSAANAESALAELYQDAKTAQGYVWLAPSAFYLLTGAPLAIFADGASAVPGSALVDSKAFAIRWNNNATLDGVLTSFPVPPDLDVTANGTATVVASKTGATLGDASTFDIGLYNQVVGALDDADTNFGGTTGAMTGNATAKTVQSVTRTITAADWAASPCNVTMTLKPTDGTLNTDDLCVLGVRITYKRKLLTS